MQHIVNNRISRHVAPVSSSAKRAAWIAVSLLGVALTAPEALRGPLQSSPTATGSVVLDQGVQTNYFIDGAAEIGGGVGVLQQFQYNPVIAFDLSSVHGQISQITFSGDSFLAGIVFSLPGYASVGGELILLGSNPLLAGDLQTAFQIATSPTGDLGFFTVDNGLTPPDGSLPIGSAFSVNIDPAAFGSPASNGGLGTVYLGFLTSNVTNAIFPQKGVMGTLNPITLQIRTVPEPASISLGLIGAAAAWGLSRKKRSRPRAPIQV